MGPRDTPTRFAVPVHPETGEPLTDAQIERVAKLRGAYMALLDILHECEGTTPGNNEHWMTRRMSIAATQIELGMAMAIRQAMEAK